MSIQLKAVPVSDSESDDDDSINQKKLKLDEDAIGLDRVFKISSRKVFSGGIVVSTEDEIKDQSTSASMSAAEKKGLKEVEELERELDLKNTFSKETNRRDEDAEMNKFIDEQIKLRREAAKEANQNLDNKKTKEKDDSDIPEFFTIPSSATDKIDDILLYSLSKHLSSTTDEKSEAMLSSQMLNGIPEVDLGISERIRTIEATEEAKLKLASSNNTKKTSKTSSSVPVNYSSNFKQHRSNRDTHEGELKTVKSEKQTTNPREVKIITEAVVVVGEEPNEIEYRLPASGERLPARGKASDDYYLSKFKKNNRK